MPNVIYTIGHSTHSTERFIELLTAHGVTAVADVRSHPYSRFNPQFNREGLRADLGKAGLAYVFLGKELGARSEDPGCYVDGKVQYDRVARTSLFQEGLSRLVQGASNHRIVLMCAEKDPLICHRAILVCRHLVDYGVGILHILEDGQIENHDEALSRLMAELDLHEQDLFLSRNEVIHEAYDRRGKQIAYSLHVADEETAGRPVV
jgi:uncharacterized protein (DUF488 family)